jgi:hypothetical protein
MKLLLLPLLLICSVIYSQQVTERKFAEFKNIDKMDYYSIKIDNNTGNYIFAIYDTTTYKTTAYNENGKIGVFDNVFYWNAVYDQKGNAYYAVSNIKDDTTSIFYMMKNDEVIGTYDYLNNNITLKDNILYFAFEREGRAFFAMMDVTDNSIKVSKPYDNIYFVSYPEVLYSEEQEGTVGFTKDGKPYYVAESAGSKVLVIGDREMKAYADIDIYSFKKDNNGQLTYIVKDKGNFYNERGNTFIVQGEKEFIKKKYDYIYSIYGFTNTNQPVYVATDSLNGNIFPQRMVIGEKEYKTYKGGVYNIVLLPTGKTAYVASDVVDAENYKFRSYLVYDGKAGKKYESVELIVFNNRGLPYYTAQKKNGKYVVVMPDGKELDKGYDYISSLKILKNGQIAYVGQYNGDYDNKIPAKTFVHIGDNVSGPFDFVMTIDFQNGDAVKVDDRGNFIYAVQKTIDWENFIYDSKVRWNNGESESYDAVNDAGLINGKPYYTALKIKDRVMNTYTYSVYYDGKKITDDYEYINEFTADDNSISFLGYKNKEYYKVNINF